MINQINVLIEVNLQLLYKSGGNSLNLKDFKDDLGNKFQDVETFIKILQKKDLITPNLNKKSCYELTEFGKQICENGGWLRHLKNQKGAKNKTAKTESREILFDPLIIVFIFIIILLFYSLQK